MCKEELFSNEFHFCFQRNCLILKVVKNFSKKIRAYFETCFLVTFAFCSITVPLCYVLCTLMHILRLKHFSSGLGNCVADKNQILMWTSNNLSCSACTFYQILNFASIISFISIFFFSFFEFEFQENTNHRFFNTLDLNLFVVRIHVKKLTHIYHRMKMFVVSLESTAADNLRTNKRSLRQVFEPNSFHGGKMARSCWLVAFVLVDKETSLVVVESQNWMMYSPTKSSLSNN